MTPSPELRGDFSPSSITREPSYDTFPSCNSDTTRKVNGCYAFFLKLFSCCYPKGYVDAKLGRVRLIDSRFPSFHEQLQGKTPHEHSYFKTIGSDQMQREDSLVG